MAATNLAQYYTGQNMALPSVASRAQQYNTYGLGSGYTGTASQNSLLLSKLQGGSSAPASSGGYSSTPAVGGFSAATPTGDPTLNSSISNLNGLQDQYQSLAAQQAKELQDYTEKQQGTIAGAFQTASGQTGLNDAASAMAKIQAALTGSQNASAAVVPQTVGAARGSMANNDQVVTQAATSNIPYAEQIAQLSANLVPAEDTYNSKLAATQAISGNIVTGAQLAEQGFSAGQQQKLQAIQSKIDQGQHLTDDEYQSYTTLTASQTAAAAQIKAAGIGAGAQIQAANIQAQAALKAAALQYPGITLAKDANGNYTGSSFLNAKDTSGPISADAIKQYLSPILSQGPSQYAGLDANYIAKVMSLGNLSQQDATNLYYSVRQPYESVYATPPPAPTPAPAAPTLNATPSKGITPRLIGQ